jgi:hypothetical protein
VITPRRTRLVRVPDLQALHAAVASLGAGVDLDALGATAVIVSTRNAARQLRRTVENLRLGSAGARAVAFARFVTRESWYDEMHARLDGPPPRLTGLEREVLLRAAAADAISGGAEPPFRLRPGLVAEILALHEALGRVNRTVDAFERLIVDDLSSRADDDRGAERLLRQTRFLVAAFRAYEARVARAGAADERRLRELLLTQPSRAPLRHAVVVAPDRSASPHGLWPADFDLLTRIPGLERVHVVATEALLASGYLERLHESLPGLEEVHAEQPSPRPHLLTPSHSERHHFVARDREEELLTVARFVIDRALSAGPEETPVALDRTAIVFERPLPYLYAAARIFEAANIPYDAVDALPLAGEPYAAALDLLLSAVSTRPDRSSTLALLRSPHFGFDGEIPSGEGTDVAAALEAELTRLADPAPPSKQLSALLEFLLRRERLPEADAPLRERHLRARGAILGAVEELRRAHARFDDEPRPFAESVATIRRWIEARTFAPRHGAGGIQLLDADAASLGDFDDVWIVGLVQGDWPPRPVPNIFYPGFLLKQLGWPLERGQVQAARAAFADLTCLARRRVVLSTFSLEDDAIVNPSGLLEELPGLGLTVQSIDPPPPAAILAEEFLSLDIVPTELAEGETAAWLALRLERTPADLPLFHGSTGPPPARIPSVTSIDTYLDCPFKYLARHVLGLEEERSDEEWTPLDRGVFVHEMFREFYDAWTRAGRGGLQPGTLGDARDEFTRIVDRHLAELPESERPFERARLLGSAARLGAAEQAFQVEIEREAPVVDRLLEVALDGDWILRGAEGPRTVTLRGTADRVDLLADHTFRLIDYKTGKVHGRGRAIQLPVYSACVSQYLRRTGRGDWKVSEAGYLAFGEGAVFLALAADPGKLADAVDEGQRRFVRALGELEAGRFPVRPASVDLCEFCGYSSVCRKDYDLAGAASDDA